MAAKCAEIDKYVMAHEYLKSAENAGIGVWIDGGKKGPEGWVPVRDPIGVKWQREVTVGKLLHELFEETKFDLFKQGFGQKLFADPATSKEIPGKMHGITKKYGKSYTELLIKEFLRDPEAFKTGKPNIYQLLEDVAATANSPALEKLFKIPKFDDQTLRLRVGGLVKTSEFFMPEQAARIINNYLSPGLGSSTTPFGSLFRAYRSAGNILNQAQLSMSAFHAGFTTLDTMISSAALGLYQSAHGDIGKGLLSVLKTPIAAITTARLGSKVLDEWRTPGSQGPEIARLVEAMELGGGRAKMDRFYKTNYLRRMKEAFHSTNAFFGSIKAAPYAPLAFIEWQMRPVMEKLVPMQKAGTFAELARYELERNPNMTHEEAMKTFGKIHDSVDNRLGQMVYDNVGWNRMLKDLLMGSFRSVGWNVGSIRELVGGMKDTLGAVKDVATLNKPEFTYRMSYLLAIDVWGMAKRNQRLLLP
jgi:hypothetical protein